jgi:hypothetical protein
MSGTWWPPSGKRKVRAPRRARTPTYLPRLEVLEDRTVLATLVVSPGGVVPLPAPPTDPVGVFDPATQTWFLRNDNSAGPPDAGQFAYGTATSLPVAGHWDGPGADTIGVFDKATATWFLRNDNSAGPPDAGQFQYGGIGWLPVTGDWQGSGLTGIGAFDPTTATWYLRNEPDAGAPDAGQFQYGVAGGIPVVGDWTGTGQLGIGVFDPATATWYLRSELNAGPPDAGVFQYGGAGSQAIAGDWTGAGHAGIGVFDPSTATFYLRTEPNAGAPDAGQFAFGGQGSLAVAGFFPPVLAGPQPQILGIVGLTDAPSSNFRLTAITANSFTWVGLPNKQGGQSFILTLNPPPAANQVSGGLVINGSGVTFLGKGGGIVATLVGLNPFRNAHQTGLVSNWQTFPVPTWFFQ